MRLRDLALSLDPEAREPLQLQIVRAITTAIQGRRILPGSALPGSRQLAEELGVHRNTVVLALQRLEAEGWIEARPNRGTFVAERLPDPGREGPMAGASPSPEEPGFDLPSGLDPLTGPAPAKIDLAEGLPDPRLAPMEALAKAYQRALRRHGDTLLASGEPKGNGHLRTTLAEFLSERRGLRVDPEQVLVTRGSRMGFDLMCLSLLKRGGAVAVENPGNPALCAALRRMPAVTVEPIPVDREGLQVDALEAVLSRTPLRFLYLTPQHQFPTTVPLSAPRRAKLLALARQHRLAILEDDYDADYHYTPGPQLPLASADPTGQVVYMGSLSKLLAPGVRLGFLVAPRGLVDRLGRVRAVLDRQGDRVLEWAVGDLIRDGDLARHIRRARRLYQERRDLLAGLLRERLGGQLDFAVPEGGMALWAEAAPGFDLEGWVGRCRGQNLVLNPGRVYEVDGLPLGGTRISFAELEADELREAVERMRRAL